MYQEPKMTGDRFSSGSAAETRQAELPHQMDMLATNAAGMAEAVAALEKRLSTVTRPQAATNEADKQLRGAANTEVGSRMQELNDSLVSTRVRAESLLARLEV